MNQCYRECRKWPDNSVVLIKYTRVCAVCSVPFLFFPFRSVACWVQQSFLFSSLLRRCVPPVNNCNLNGNVNVKVTQFDAKVSLFCSVNWISSNLHDLFIHLNVSSAKSVLHFLAMYLLSLVCVFYAPLGVHIINVCSLFNYLLFRKLLDRFN